MALNNIFSFHDINLNKKNLPYDINPKGLEDYWNKVINFDYLAELGLIEDKHLNLFQYADTASEAWKIIKSSKEPA